jgi:uncharacterized protein
VSDSADTIRSVLACRDEVVAAYLFGSVAAGRGHAFSDIDIAVLLAEGPSEHDLFKQELALGGLLDSVFSPTRVDLVVLNRAGPFIAFQVLKTGKLVLDNDPDTRSLFVMHALNRYYDQKPYLDYQRACVVERARRGELGHGYRRDRRPSAKAGLIPPGSA